MPFVFLPVYARSVNIEVMDVALLLSILGGANTFGRLVAGALGGKTWVDALIVNNVALVLAGGATVALPFCDSHYLLVTFAAVFGLCVGKWCLGSLSPINPTSLLFIGFKRVQRLWLSVHIMW